MKIFCRSFASLFGVVAVLTHCGINHIDAFIQPKFLHLDGARTTQLHESAGSAVKNGIKFLLVPNAKKPYTPSSSTFGDNDVITTADPTAAASIAPVSPTLDLPEFVGATTLGSDPTQINPILNNPEVASISTLDSIADKLALLVAPALNNNGAVGSAELTNSLLPAASVEIMNNNNNNIFGSTAANAVDQTVAANAADQTALAFSDTMPDILQFFPAEKFAASFASLGEILPSKTATLPDLLNALDLENLGGWYIGIFSILLASVTSGTRDTSVDITTIGDGSSSASMNPLSLPLNSTTTQSAEEISSIVDLTFKIGVLKSEIEELNAELKGLKESKIQSDYQLATLKSDMRNLQNELRDSHRNEAQLVEAIKAAETKLSKETERYEKELDEAYAKLGKSRVKKVVAPEPKLAPTTITVEVIEPKNLASLLQPPKKNGKVSHSEKVQANGVAEPEVVNDKQKTSKKSSKRTNKSAKAVEIEANNNWSTLTSSTLKRKTVKDLTEYLKEKGGPTTDADGNPLKKVELVEAVLSL